MAREPNPIRRYKLRHDLTFPALAEALGISEDYAKKLGTPRGVTSLSPEMAKQFERLTNGEIRFLDVMRWIEANLDGSDGARAA